LRIAQKRIILTTIVEKDELESIIQAAKSLLPTWRIEITDWTDKEE
jgi:hypothetical protein